MLVVQLCPTLWDPMDYSPPVSSVHRIFQARILKWIVIPFSRGSCWPRDRTEVSCIAWDSLPSEPPEKPLIKVTQPKQWRVSVPYLGLSVTPADIFDDHDCVGSLANGILWVEPEMMLNILQSTGPKEASGPNVRSAKVKKLWSRDVNVPSNNLSEQNQNKTERLGAWLAIFLELIGHFLGEI